MTQSEQPVACPWCNSTDHWSKHKHNCPFFMEQPRTCGLTAALDELDKP